MSFTVVKCDLLGSFGKKIGTIATQNAKLRILLEVQEVTCVKIRGEIIGRFVDCRDKYSIPVQYRDKDDKIDTEVSIVVLLFISNRFYVVFLHNTYIVIFILYLYRVSTSCIADLSPNTANC